MNFQRLLRQFCLPICLIAVSACGGGGGGDSTPSSASTISGTAAAGAPLIGTVTIKDSTGATRSASIAADGSYSVDVSNMVAPFMVRAEGTVGGSRYTLFSAATNADINGNINVTPLTDLIIANVARQVAADFYASGNFGNLTASELDAAEDVLQQRLQDVLDGIGVAQAVDLLRTSFRTDSTGLDAALDILRVSVDQAANTATITNVLNNASIIDDLSLLSDVDVISASGTATGLTAWQAIQARFDSFEAAFASALPAHDDPVLLAQFDQTNFLESGFTLAAVVSDITSDPDMIGIEFASLSLVSLTSANASQNGTALVRYGAGDATRGYSYSEMYLTGIYNSGNGSTNWVLAGNQRILDYWTTATAIMGFNPTDENEIQSGIEIDVENTAGSANIDYAVATGPGLPTSGGGADGSSAGVVLVPHPYGDDFCMVPSPYSGPLDINLDPNTDIHPRARYNWDMYAMTVAEVAGLPGNNLVYTVNIYDDNGTPANLSDDVLQATYQHTVMLPPDAADSLSAQSFAQLTAPSDQEIWNVLAQTGGDLHFSWTAPSGWWVESISLDRTSASFNRQDFDVNVTPPATSATVQIPAPTETIVRINGEIFAGDFYQREYIRMRTAP